MSSNAQRTSTTAKRPLEWMRFDPVKFMFLIEDLTFEEVGAVTKVMLKLWQFGPMSEVDLRKASKAHFEVIKNLTFEVDNLLSFELVEDARDHGERRRNQRVEAGIASAAKRNERLTTVQRTVNDRSTVVLSVSKSSSDSTSKRKERAKSKSIEDRKSEFITKCAAVVKSDPTRLPDKLRSGFFEYWTEPTQDGKGMRFEAEKFFDHSRRMATWKANAEKRGELVKEGWNPRA